MFECVHIVLRMMLSPARGFAPPSLYRNSCKVECLIKENPPYDWKSLIKENPLSRNIPDIINMFIYFVSRHTLKYTMQQFQNINTNIGKTTDTKTTKEVQTKTIKTIENTKTTKKQLSDPCPLWPTWVRQFCCCWFFWFSRWF